MVVALIRSLASTGWVSTAALSFGLVTLLAILVTVGIPLIGRFRRPRYTISANALWVAAGVIFVLSVGLLTAGNVLAAHQSAHWWHAVVYADLGGLGAFISALVAIAAVKFSSSSGNSASSQSDNKGMNHNERKFMSELMNHMAHKELTLTEVEQINQIAGTLGRPKQDVNLTNIYHPIVPDSEEPFDDSEGPLAVDDPAGQGPLSLPGATGEA